MSKGASEGKRNKSWVWEHVTVHEASSKICCSYCLKQITDSGNTTNIAKHLAVHRVFPTTSPAPATSTQTTLLFQPPIKETSELANKIVDAIVRLIVHHNLPLSTTDAPELKELCDLLRPGSSRVLPSRHGLRAKLIPQAADVKRALIDKRIRCLSLFPLPQFLFT